MLTLHRICLGGLCLSVAAVACATRPSLGDNIDGGGSGASGGKTGGTGGGGSNTGGVAAGTGGAGTGGSGTGGAGAGGAGTGGAGTGGAGARGGGGGTGGIGGGSAAGRGGEGIGATAGAGGGGASGSGGGGGGTISYAGCTFAGGINRVVLAKRDTVRDLCLVLVLDSPGSNPFNLTLPQNTGMEYAYAMRAQADCRQRVPPLTGAASALAGTGSVVSFPTPQPTYTVDVTFTFQPDASIGVGASERLMVSNVLAGLNCP